ncbi:DNA repair protein RecN [Pseudoalteromonas fenneropenaei]|uniref:DNA repair protein RecN n=1 Tax=Pseudoalteromonas fenneropenaei TaxID=1737459 RepID=A0ABV7CPI0_9GAMM
MLVSLEIQNYAIVSDLSIEWQRGMTAITGETGAGKSIAIDALSLCLGERSDASSIRPGAEKAEIAAEFEVKNLPAALAYLQEHMLEGEQGECILRRVVAKNGRSKNYINGVAVTAAQLKDLGQLLIAIHGQHAHQLLLKNDHQLLLLDAYAGHDELLKAVKSHYQTCQKLYKEQQTLLNQQQQLAAQKQLLEYQVAELDEFALQPGEFEEIETEHSRLSHSQTILETCQRELQYLYEADDHTVLSQLQHACSQFFELADYDKALEPIANMLQDACVQVEEASREIRHYSADLEQDPERLELLDNRMARTLDLARKHHVKPELLAEHHQQLMQELNNIEASDSRLDELADEIKAALHQYEVAANALSNSRTNAAQTLNGLITQSMASLSMAQGKFAIELTPRANSKPNVLGLDEIEFLVSTNPGQPMQALGKVASGGELSRISLAIQVIIAQRVTTPTLIFDEVDVGISGPTAAAVGKLLRQLGQSTQVICVTHLPQVASCAHQQFFVSKFSDDQTTFTSMQALDDSGRVEEIARLLGGDVISATTRASAKELLTAH